MRTTKQKTIPAQTCEVIDEIICDVCKTAKGTGTLADETVYWSYTDAHNTRQTTVDMRLGNEWPEGGSGTRVTVDICPGCFKKMLAWLQEEFGVVPHERSYDY
jgi:hypothetical protein